MESPRFDYAYTGKLAVTRSLGGEVYGYFKRSDRLEFVDVEELLRKVEYFRQVHVKVLVVTLRSPGGEVAQAIRIYEALRQFSRDGGRVVVLAGSEVDTYTDPPGMVASSALIVMSAGDYIVCDPRALLLFHSCHTNAGPYREGNKDSIAILESRTGAPRSFLEFAYSQSETRGQGCVEVTPTLAVGLGIVDMVGSHGDLLSLLNRADAGEPFPDTIRQRAIRERAHLDVPRPLPGYQATNSVNRHYVPVITRRGSLLDAALNWSPALMPVVGTWRGIAECTDSASANQGRIVVVSTNAAYTSDTGGQSWTSRTIGFGTWNAVSWAGSQFVAVGASCCATSPNGVTWTGRTIPAGTYTAVTFGAGLYVAVGPSSLCATSPDGITWTSRTFPGGYGIAWNGSRFATVGTGAWSTDGITWTSSTGGMSGTHRAVAWLPEAGLFLSVGDEVAAVSVDGDSWGALSVPVGLNFVGIAVGGGVAVAVGNDGPNRGHAWATADGQTWALVSPGIATAFASVLFSPGVNSARGQFVAMGQPISASASDPAIAISARVAP